MERKQRKLDILVDLYDFETLLFVAYGGLT